MSSDQQSDLALVWEWIADYNCYNMFNDEARLDSIENFTMLMRNANRSLFFNKDEILATVKSNLIDHELDDANKRILYSCLVTQTFLSFEKQIDKIVFLDEELPPLESVLNLIDSMISCVSSLEQDLLNNLWITVFKELMKRQLISKCDCKYSVDDIILKFGKNISESSRSSVLAFSGKLDGSNIEQTICYQDFFLSVYSIVCQLHSNIDEPFLLKVQMKLDTQKNNESNVNTVDQSIYEHARSQLALLQKLNSDCKYLKAPAEINKSKSANCMLERAETALSKENILIASAEKNNRSNSEEISDSENNISDAIMDHQQSSTIEVTKVAKTINKQEKSCLKSKDWSLRHDAFVIAGVEKFGLDAWNKIKQFFPFPLLETANSSVIKDRWSALLQNKVVELHPDNTIRKVNSQYNKYLKIARKKASNCSKKTVPMKKVSNINENLHGQPEHIDKTLLKYANHPKPIFAGRRTWSKQEDAYLISGVLEHGHSWVKILDMFPFRSNRTGVHLKDRWRNMKKLNLVTVNENGKVVAMASEYKVLLDNL